MPQEVVVRFHEVLRPRHTARAPGTPALLLMEKDLVHTGVSGDVTHWKGDPFS